MATASQGSQLTGEAREAYVKDLFDQLAQPYDRLNRIISMGRDDIWRKELIHKSTLKSGGRAVDLGTGTGDLLLGLRQTVGESGQIVGLDLSPGMLTIAAEKLKSRFPDASNVILTEGNAGDTGLEPDQFDVATMGWVLRNVGDRQIVYQEVLRILKPGGHFAILEMSQPDNTVLRFFSRIYVVVIMPLLARLFGGNHSSFKYLAASTLEFPDKESLSREWTDAGFTDVQSTSLMMGNISMHIGKKKN